MNWLKLEIKYEGYLKSGPEVEKMKYGKQIPHLDDIDSIAAKRVKNLKLVIQKLDWCVTYLSVNRLSHNDLGSIQKQTTNQMGWPQF